MYRNQYIFLKKEKGIDQNMRKAFLAHSSIMGRTCRAQSIIPNNGSDDVNTHTHFEIDSCQLLQLLARLITVSSKHL